MLFNVAYRRHHGASNWFSSALIAKRTSDQGQFSVLGCQHRILSGLMFWGCSRNNAVCSGTKLCLRNGNISSYTLFMPCIMESERKVSHPGQALTLTVWSCCWSAIHLDTSTEVWDNDFGHPGLWSDCQNILSYSNISTLKGFTNNIFLEINIRNYDLWTI